MLLDHPIKLSDNIETLKSAYTDDYSRGLLDFYAKVNPDVSIHIVSDLDKAPEDIRDNLKAGGYVPLDQNIAYVYPASTDWEASFGELINHELIHALTEASLQSGNPNYTKAIDHLYQMMDQILSHHESNPDGDAAQILDIIKDLPREQALSEFVAYGMAEPSLARYIDNTLDPKSTKGLTLSKRVSKTFDYFIAVVYSALGLKKTGYKAFNKTVQEIFGEPTSTADSTRYSASAMKSQQANIKRGRDAMNQVITTKADVHRAMYRNDIGWIDFVWSSTGTVKANGKTRGAMGISHIIEARMRKDDMSYDDVVKMLTKNIVETIAQGEIFTDSPLRIQLRHNGYEAVLAKSKGANDWVVTAYELYEYKKSDGGQGVGFDTSKPTHTNPTLARDGMGASDETTVSQSNLDNNQDTRYSQLFDETDKQSASEVMASLDNQKMSDEFAVHLQEVWDSMFEGNITYSSLSLDDQNLLVDYMTATGEYFTPASLGMSTKEQLTYQATASILVKFAQRPTARMAYC